MITLITLLTIRQHILYIRPMIRYNMANKCGTSCNIYFYNIKSNVHSSFIYSLCVLEYFTLVENEIKFLR